MRLLQYRELMLFNSPGTLPLVEIGMHACKAGISLWLQDLSMADRISKRIV